MVLEVQFAVVLKHPLTPTIDTQLTFLLARLTIQLVVALRAIEPRQRYLTNIANPPIGVQSMAQLARQLVLVLGGQAQLQGFPQVCMQVHLPVA